MQLERAVLAALVVLAELPEDAVERGAERVDALLERAAVLLALADGHERPLLLCQERAWRHLHLALLVARRPRAECNIQDLAERAAGDHEAAPRQYRFHVHRYFYRYNLKPDT